MRDLGLEEVEVASASGAVSAGAVAGETASGASIERVYVRGGTGITASGTGGAGGIVGSHAGGTIEKSYVTGVGVINRSSSPGSIGSPSAPIGVAGGLVGVCDGATIEDTWSDAATGGSLANGGLVGQLAGTAYHQALLCLRLGHHRGHFHGRTHWG